MADTITPAEARTAPRTATRAPAPPEDAGLRSRLGTFVTRHADLLTGEAWEGRTPPVPEFLAAAGAAGLLRAAWADTPADRPRALWAAVALHTAFARVGGGAPGAALLTHLDVATRLLGSLPGADRALVDAALEGRTTSALAATEPRGGSDLSSLTTVVRDGRVSGEKWFISNAPYADRLLVLAAGPDGAGGRGPALVQVDAHGPGVTVRTQDGLGHHRLTGAIRLDGAPVEAVLAPAPRGLLVLMRHWLHERVMLAVRMAELAAAVLDHAVADATGRHTFGSPLVSRQHVRFTLARLDADVAEVRAAAHQGVRLLAAGTCPGGYAAAVKYRAAAVLREVADEAVQFAGGAGYTNDHPAARALRDAAGLALAGGTDELMLQQIDRG